jgi:hypothetical protein
MDAVITAAQLSEKTPGSNLGRVRTREFGQDGGKESKFCVCDVSRQIFESTGRAEKDLAGGDFRQKPFNAFHDLGYIFHPGIAPIDKT